METEEQRIIRYADIMIAHADYTGLIDKDCLDIIGAFSKDVLHPDLAAVRQELRSMQPNNFDASTDTTNLEITKSYATKNYDDIRTHLMNNLYIDKPNPGTQEWILNDVGKKMKQLKGHNKYQEYIDKKLKAEIAEMDGKIYWKRRVFISAILGLIAGLLISWIVTKLNLQPTNPTSSVETQLSTPAK